MRLYTILFFIPIICFFSKVSSAYAADASLRCNPSSGTYGVGEIFTVEYLLDTRDKQSYGANVVITYDTSVFTADGIQSTPITSVTNWTVPVTNTIDSQTGTITLDYGNGQSMFQGSTAIGKVSLKGVKEAQGQFNFVFFQPNDNTTPGIASVWGQNAPNSVTNVLSDVNNCIYLVQGFAATPTVVLNPTLAVSATPTISQLPRTGKNDTVRFLLFASLSMLGIGAIIPALRAIGSR